MSWAWAVGNWFGQSLRKTILPIPAYRVIEMIAINANYNKKKIGLI